MDNEPVSLLTPDKRLAAVCGLFCPACNVFIGSHGDPQRLRKIAQRLGFSIEEVECEGCRSAKRSFSCREDCHMANCAAGKGIDFCSECAEYPCAQLQTFQSQMPHRIELWQSLERIREAGYEKWYTEMVGHYSCSECHTINSAYDAKCRKCGHTPSCDYVALHKEEFARFMERISAPPSGE